MKLALLILLLSLQVIAKPVKNHRHHHSKNNDVVKSIVKAAKLVGVDPYLLLAVCWVESSHRPNLKPRMDGLTQSHGICQVKLETAQHMDKVYRHKYKATNERLQSPFVNAFYAAKYIKYQIKRYKGSINCAIEAYNRGYAAHHGIGIYVNKVMYAMGEQNKQNNNLLALSDFDY